MYCPPRHFGSDCQEGKRTHSTTVSPDTLTLIRRSLVVARRKLKTTAVALV